MANYDDRLKDYVDVKERIKLFYERFPDGRLVTDDIWMTHDADGLVRVWGRALAYRTPDDPLPGKGTSYMTVPGTTPYTRGSEAENVETSCWGRAIGSLGIGIDKSIASAQEVANKQDDGSAPRKTPEPAQIAQDGLIGTVEKGKPPVDMEARQVPEGGVAWGFSLKDGSRRFQVMAQGALADVLAMVPDLTGQRVTCWGTIEMIPWYKNDKAMPPYPRLHLSKIQTPDFTLPSESEGVEPEAVEPDSIPLFDDVA